LNVNAFDRYRNGDMNIYIGLRSRLSGQQCDLVFSRIPSDASPARADNIFERFGTSNSSGEESIGPCKDKWLECEVFICVSDLVRGPEGIIPSWVSLELFEDRADFRGQILAATGQIVPKFLLARSERKLDGLEGRRFGRNGAGVTNLIEDRTEIVRGIEQDTGQKFRELLLELDFIKIAANLGIFVNEAGPWLSSMNLLMASLNSLMW
jgi:hypothetical protein